MDPEGWDAALAQTDGPQLVVAGPGTGKTEFLVRRVAVLVEQGVDPEHIHLLTFSRRAAADTRRRIQSHIGATMGAVGCSTFHSFSRRLLESLAPDRQFDLMTGPEQVTLVSQLLKQEKPGDWPLHLRGLLASPTLAADVADFLMRTAERSLTAEDVAGRGYPEWKALPGFMETYRRTLERVKKLDYARLLTETARVLSEGGRAERVADQFRHLLVDEYQDTSPAQVAVLEPIVTHHHNLVAAGDPYQSVYSFRGAEVGAVADFPRRFRDGSGNPARRIVLTTSFRVPAPILDAALAVTRSSDVTLPGAAGPVIPARHPGVVETYVFDQASAEADWIAAEIERVHLTENLAYRHMAILLRSKRRLLPELSRALSRHRVPHDLPDSRLVDHPAVQLVFDLARLAAHDRSGFDPEIDTVARRVLLGPLVAAGLGEERQMVRTRRRTADRWRDIFEDSGLTDLARFLSSGGWAESDPAADGLWTVWSEILCRIPSHPAEVAYRSAWTSLSQVLDRLAERDPAVTLIDYWRASLDEDFEATPLISFKPGGEGVTLTTLHQSKGLEFDTVFIAGADDETFPDLRRGISLLGDHRLSVGNEPNAFRRFRIQEEMRLAYTAMSRASRRVVWTATATSEQGNRPSRFLRSVAGVSDRSLLGPPPPSDPTPTTRRQMEVALRRTLVDPAIPAARRLAAARVLSAHFDTAGFAGVPTPGPDTGVLGPHPTFSPSQAESYATCPRRYVLDRRVGVGDQHTSHTRFGSLVHEVLERSERAIIEGTADGISRELVEHHLDRVWEEKAQFGSPNLNHAYREKAMRLLQRLIDQWPADAHHPVALEYPLELDLDGLRWRGRADRIDMPRPGVLRIVDHKTGSRSISKNEAATSLQLGFYLLAGNADPGLAAQGTVEEAEMWMFGTKLKDFRRCFDITRLDEVAGTLGGIGRQMLTEDWRPTAGAGCRSCPVRLVCPRWPEGDEGFLP